MRRGGRVLILLGLVLAVVAGAGVFLILASAEPGPAEVQRTRVVIALQPIPERAEISADQIGVANWPVLDDFPTPPGVYTDPKDVIGKLANAPIAQGQAITSFNLIDKTQAKERRSNASFILEPGHVAIALPLNNLSSVGNALQNGDRVDLIATFTVQPFAQNQSTGPEQTATQRTLQNVLVLQVGAWPNPAVQAQSSGSQSQPVPVVTVQVTEQDAQVLQFIDTQATTWTFVLRPVNDEQLYNPNPVTIDYVNRRFGYQFTGQIR